MLTQTKLKEVLRLDSATGQFFWLAQTSSKSRINIGDFAGNFDSEGYVRIKIEGRTYKAHHLVWLWHTGALPVRQIDHINRIKDDNRFENLRETTQAENLHNRTVANRRNKTGLLGVNTYGGWFHAILGVRGKRIHLGKFNSKEEAHAAYMEAKRKYHSFEDAK